MVLKKHLVVVMSNFNKQMLDKDIQINNMEDRYNEASYTYHENLLKLLDAKTNGDGEGGKTINELYRNVHEVFSSVIVLQKNMVEASMDLVKLQLQRAFEVSGLDKVIEENHDGQ
jgi:hypothetical protein